MGRGGNCHGVEKEAVAADIRSAARMNCRSRWISGPGMNELSVAVDIRPRHKLVNAAAESVNGVSMQYSEWGRFCIDIPRHFQQSGMYCMNFSDFQAI